MSVIVEIQDGCYLSSEDGYPDRTLNKNSAYVFQDVEGAFQALSKARKSHPFKNGKVLHVEVTLEIKGEVES